MFNQIQTVPTVVEILLCAMTSVSGTTVEELGDIPGEKGRQEDEAAGDLRTSFVGFVRTG